MNLHRTMDPVDGKVSGAHQAATIEHLAAGKTGEQPVVCH